MTEYTCSYEEALDYLTRRSYSLGLDESSPNACDRQAAKDILPMIHTALQYLETLDGSCPTAIIASVLGDVKIVPGHKLTINGISLKPGEQIYPGDNPTPYDMSNPLALQMKGLMKGWRKVKPK